MSNNESTRLYRESGVDIEKADKLVDWLQEADASQTTKHGAAVAGVGVCSLIQARFFRT